MDRPSVVQAGAGSGSRGSPISPASLICTTAAPNHSALAALCCYREACTRPSATCRRPSAACRWPSAACRWPKWSVRRSFGPARWVVRAVRRVVGAV